MDKDVLALLRRLLLETQFPVFGSEIAEIAELHGRALSQVDAAAAGDEAGGDDELRLKSPLPAPDEADGEAAGVSGG